VESSLDHETLHRDDEPASDFVLVLVIEFSARPAGSITITTTTRTSQSAVALFGEHWGLWKRLSLQEMIIGQPIGHSLWPVPDTGQFRTAAHIESVAAVRQDVHLDRTLNAAIFFQ
jgi:hypothetical protein